MILVPAVLPIRAMSGTGLAAPKGDTLNREAARQHGNRQPFKKEARMIIEQHITTPPGYVSARVITFRGDPAEEADGPEEKAIGARVEPAWERFIGHVLTFRKPFTSGDIPGFTVAKASRYMTRAVQRGVIRKLGTDHPGYDAEGVPTGRPKNLYEVAR